LRRPTGPPATTGRAPAPTALQVHHALYLIEGARLCRRPVAALRSPGNLSGQLSPRRTPLRLAFRHGRAPFPERLRRPRLVPISLPAVESMWRVGPYELHDRGR
jgi:hypothetical protein